VLLELFYEAVAILNRRDQPSEDSDTPTMSYMRQNLAALRVQSLLASPDSDLLPPLRMVPYALSLSMSVSYRHLRHNQLSTSRTNAKREIEKCCILLDALEQKWWAASAMASLGRETLRRLEGKLSIARSRAPSPPNAMSQVNSSTSHVPAITAAQPGSAQEIPHLESMADLMTPESLNQEFVPSRTAQHDLGAHLPNESANQNLWSSTLLPELNWMNFDTTVDNLDALLYGYADLNLPTNFADPISLYDPATIPPDMSH
jgi:hypothetical protein